MTPAETARVLALVAAFDRRTVGREDVEAWHLVLGDLDAQEVADAVRAHFTESREWLMPADIRTHIRNVHRGRLRLVPDEIPDADPDNPAEYIRALREQRYRAANGTERPRPVAQLLTQVERSTTLEDGRP